MDEGRLSSICALRRRRTIAAQLGTQQRQMRDAIGLLTSGGICAGLSAMIRALVLRAVRAYRFEVIGLHAPTDRLMQRPPAVSLLTPDSVWGMLF